MDQLNNLDNLFIHLDTANTPMHIGSLSVYDQATAPGGKIRYKDILAYYQSCLPKAKCYRRKLAKVPMGIGNHYWVEDEDFDLEFHVRHIALPSPGDWRQLSILVARLFSRPLDMSKPLWEVYVIEGLDNVKGLPKGCFALLHKVHHSAIDGVSGAEILTATHTLDSNFSLENSEDNWKAESMPSDLNLYLRGLKQQIGMPVQYTRYMRRYYKRLMSASSWFKQGDHHVENAPATRFNNNITPYRIFDGVKFDINEIKAIKNQVPGTTLNDVILTICGGGLRRYLETSDEKVKLAHKENLNRSLIAMMPKSIRDDQQKGSEGNQISILRVAIGSQIEDPVARLHFVSQATNDAKELLSILGDDIVAQSLGLLNPLASKYTASTMMASQMAKVVRLFNTVITNVPGPNFPLYFMGCKMLDIYGMGPPAGGLGLFQVVFSYNGTISIGYTACREMMPDPAHYADCLNEAFKDLQTRLIVK